MTRANIAYETYADAGVTRCAAENLAECLYVDSFPLEEADDEPGDD